MYTKLWPYCIIYSQANKAILNLNLTKENVVASTTELVIKYVCRHIYIIAVADI